MTRDLEGKVAVVTGGSRGIGRAIAVALGARGARVVVNFTANEAAAVNTVQMIVAAGGTGVTLRFDVADAAAVDTAFKEIVTAEGGLHILVNNAGVAVNALTLGSKDADWRRSLDINLGGTVNCTRAALQSLDEGARGRPHRQHHLGGGRDGLGRAGAVRRGQGGHRRPDQDLGAGIRVARRDGQRGLARATSTPT